MSEQIDLVDELLKRRDNIVNRPENPVKLNHSPVFLKYLMQLCLDDSGDISKYTPETQRVISEMIRCFNPMIGFLINAEIFKSTKEIILSLDYVKGNLKLVKRGFSVKESHHRGYY